MIYREQINGILEELRKRKDQIQEELKILPEGYLNIRMKKQKAYYTWQIPAKGKRKKFFRKGISKDSEQIERLVRKRYLEGALERVVKNIEITEAVLQKYRDFDERSVMKEYIEKHPVLKSAVFYGKANSDEWVAKYRKPVDFYEDGLKSTSSSGARMRSKGEIIIASRLDFYEIPYRYEAPIEHPDLKRIPDFTIKRPRDNKIIYWEHLGLINNEGYLKGNIQKLEEYGDIGVTPWSNLILTYDQADGGIDVRIIDGLIQGWLL